MTSDDRAKRVQGSLKRLRRRLHDAWVDLDTLMVAMEIEGMRSLTVCGFAEALDGLRLLEAFIQEARQAFRAQKRSVGA